MTDGGRQPYTGRLPKEGGAWVRVSGYRYGVLDSAQFLNTVIYMSRLTGKMASSPQASPINERAQHLLKVLVERYIREGQPVGSRTLLQDAKLDLSPATIRNVMADLEDMGLVSSPHTSAGRVPTVSGYRLFVDSLLTVRKLNPRELQRLQQEFELRADPQALIAQASSLLSGISKMAGVVTLPRREQVTLRQVEFMPLSEQRILVISVMSDGDVQNRIIHTERSYSKDALREVANYLNQHFSGQSLGRIRERMLSELQEAREHMNQVMLTAVEMAEKAFEETAAPKDDFVLAGQTNLMGFDGISSVERLRELFEAFNQKRDILHLLDQCLQAERVQIYIGDESGYQPLQDCSVVTAPYAVDGEIVGVLGVIGPTRMAYERVIPIVDVTAKLLGAALNQQK